MADYDKAAIKKILMERDDMEAEDAQDLIDECQEDFVAGVDAEIALLGLEDLIEEYFGLEPDYLDCFLPEEKIWNMKCHSCGHEYEVRDHSGDKAMERCPKCNQSRVGVR